MKRFDSLLLAFLVFAMASLVAISYYGGYCDGAHDAQHPDEKHPSFAQVLQR